MADEATPTEARVEQESEDIDEEIEEASGRKSAGGGTSAGTGTSRSSTQAVSGRASRSRSETTRPPRPPRPPRTKTLSAPA